MPQIINCPQCERKLRVPDELQGTRVQCPTCGVTFVAPTASVPPTSSLPADSEAAPSPEPFPEETAPRDDEIEVPGERRAGEYEPAAERPPRRHIHIHPHRGPLILVLGILSLICCPLGFLGPVAWIMGSHDLKAIRAGRMDPEGVGITNGGRICGIIGTFVNLVFPVCCGIPAIVLFTLRRAAAVGHGF